MSPSLRASSYLVIALSFMTLVGPARAQEATADTPTRTYNYVAQSNQVNEKTNDKVAELDAAIKAYAEEAMAFYQKKIDTFSSGDCSQGTIKQFQKEDDTVIGLQQHMRILGGGGQSGYLARRQALSPEYAQAMKLQEDANIALGECFDNSPSHLKYLEAVAINKVVKRFEQVRLLANKAVDTPLPYCKKALSGYYTAKAAQRTPAPEFEKYAANPKVIAKMNRANIAMAAAEAHMSRSPCADELNNEEYINALSLWLVDKDNGITRPRPGAGGKRGRGAAQPAVEDSSIEEDVEETEPATDTQ